LAVVARGQGALDVGQDQFLIGLFEGVLGELLDDAVVSGGDLVVFEEGPLVEAVQPLLHLLEAVVDLHYVRHQKLQFYCIRVAALTEVMSLNVGLVHVHQLFLEHRRVQVFVFVTELL